MPSYPPKPGRKHLTIDLPVEQVTHLDSEADVRGLTRAGYLRQLIFDDMRRQGRSRRQAARNAG
jgi:hypothetical protein